MPLHDIRSARANFYPETHFVFGIPSIDLMDDLNFLALFKMYSAFESHRDLPPLDQKLEKFFETRQNIYLAKSQSSFGHSL
jgi:hypothetical protein